MNELDTFTINFVTEGIDKLLDGMDKLNKQMDKVDTSFVKAGSKGDSFFNKFIGWGTKITGLIGGIYGIGKAITDTINSSNEILTLHKTADEVGHTAKEIEVLGLTLQRFSPNLSLTSAYGQAGSFYKALNDLRLDEARLSPNSSFMEELNRARTSAILATDSDQEIVRKLRVGVQNYLNTQSPEIASASIERLLSAAGISYKDMGGLFKASDADFNFIMQEMNKKAWRHDPKYQQEAQNLAEARLQLSETWKKITDDMMPTVTKLTNSFSMLLTTLKPVIELLVIALDKIIGGYAEALEAAKKVGSKLGIGVSDAINEFKGARSLGLLNEYLGAGDNWWKSANYGEVLKLYGKAKSFMDNSIGTKWDTEENRAILNQTWDRLQVLGSNRLNTINNINGQKPNLIIERTENNNINVNSEELGSTLDSLSGRTTTADINAAQNAMISY